MTSQPAPILGESTTAAMASKALNVSRKTITRMIADGRLEDAGTGPDGDRLVSMSSLVRQQAERRAITQPQAPPTTTADPILVEMFDALREELSARRTEAHEMREQLSITERSMSTLEAERERLRTERDRAIQLVRDVSEAGPLQRRKKRRELAAFLAGQAGTMAGDKP